MSEMLLWASVFNLGDTGDDIREWCIPTVNWNYLCCSAVWCL